MAFLLILFQFAVIVGMGGWLISIHASDNGFAIGVVTFVTARVLTVGLGRLIDLTSRLAARARRSKRPEPELILSPERVISLSDHRHSLR